MTCLGEEWESVTDDAKDLISKMLTKPDKRLTASQVLEHQWFKTEKKSNNKININVQHLKNFIASSKLQKVVLTCMASQLSESEIMDLGKIFLQLDKNGDGTLTLEELTEGIRKLF